ESSHGHGFIHNMKWINAAYEEERLFTVETENIAVGFISWKIEHLTAEIDIMAINADYRKNGLGKKLYSLTEKFLKTKGFVVVSLISSPRSSEGFWSKMGFHNFPDEMGARITHFKPLVDTCETSHERPPNRIELWSSEPYMVRHEQLEPDWIWDTSEISSPILQPCNGDWTVSIFENGSVVGEEKTKLKRSVIQESLLDGLFLYISGNQDITSV